MSAGDRDGGESQAESIRVLRPSDVYVDERGSITWLTDGPFASLQVITSHRGAVRANHYHRTDAHYCLVQSGLVEYYERRHGEEAVGRRLLQPGDLVFTPAGHEHATRFIEDSLLICWSANPRDYESYERDTVRVRALT